MDDFGKYFSADGIVKQEEKSLSDLKYAQTNLHPISPITYKPKIMSNITYNLSTTSRKGI